jgi:hypothetical protein
MRCNFHQLLLTVLAALAITAPALADEPTPALPQVTLATASAMVGQPLPEDAGYKPLLSVFPPWKIAENHVRSVDIALADQGDTRWDETFTGMHEHVLVQDDKVVGVRLFLVGAADMKQSTRDDQRARIEAISLNVLGAAPPPEGGPAVPWVLEGVDDGEYLAEQHTWAYSAEDGLSYTLAWQQNAFIELWVEDPSLVRQRVAQKEG